MYSMFGSGGMEQVLISPVWFMWLFYLSYLMIRLTNPAGGMSSISLLAVPAFLPSASANSPGHSKSSARQFRTMYSIGLITQPPATILTSLAFFFLAHRHYYHLPLTLGKPFPANAPAEWKLWLTGGMAVLAVVPYTLLVLEPTSQAILKSAEGEQETIIGRKGLWSEEKKQPIQADDEGTIADACEVVKGMGDDGEVENLLVRWATLNAIRGFLPLVGAGIGLYALLS